MAHLVDPLTEGHTDSKDLEKGMAALTCFGEFEGKFSVFPAYSDKYTNKSYRRRPSIAATWGPHPFS